jgi:hypothetical protein
MTPETARWLGSIPGAVLYRRHHCADGTPKVAMTESAARQHAAWMSQERGMPFSAYECPICWQFHIGHRRPDDTQPESGKI